MKFHYRWAVNAFIIVGLFCVSTAPAWGLRYTITDLGTLGGTRIVATGINNNGQVVGYATTEGGSVGHAFLYSNGVMTDLGTLSGLETIAWGINDNGQVVGYAQIAGDNAYHAFLYSNNLMTDLGTLGGTSSYAYGINNSGQVVGYALTAGNANFRAFLYSNNVMTDLGTLGGGASWALGINNNGQVVGYAYTSNSGNRAFLYSDGLMTDLGTLGGTLSYAYGINNNGQVVGYALTSGNAAEHAFLYSNGVMTDLGTLGGTGSWAFGINNNGQVVGCAWTAGNAAQHAFLYSGGSMLDLNNLLSPGSGWTVERARGINNLGQIVGNGYFKGQYRAFIMTPESEPVAKAGPDQAVPEGALVVLDGTGSSGQNLTYSWVQVAGPTVQLRDASETAVNFDAPELPGGFGSQTLTFQLTVTNPIGASSDTVDIVVANNNHAPMAVTGSNQVVQEGSAVFLLGTNSFDPDGDAITYQWFQTSGPSVQLIGADTSTAMFTAPLVAGGVGSGVTLGFELTVSDGVLSSIDEIVVTVEQDNQSPVADASLPQTVNSGTVVSLKGTASSDPDGDPLLFQWSQTGGPSVALMNTTTANPIFTAPAVVVPTDLTFRLTVSDGALFSDPASVVVTVIRPSDPPFCDLAQATPGHLWPPNHGMVSVQITGVTDPNNNGIAIAITQVTQDEPVNGLGDGDTSPDAVLQGNAVLLRAERAGNRNGRVYKVGFLADDGQGGVCTGTVKVVVPHSMKPGLPIIEDGEQFDSTQP